MVHKISHQSLRVLFTVRSLHFLLLFWNCVKTILLVALALDCVMFAGWLGG